MPEAKVQQTDFTASNALDRVQKLSGAISRFRGENETLAKEAKRLEKELAAVTKERDELAIKADTSVAAKKVDELTAQLRGLKTRQAFDKLALQKGADPKALEDLWTLSKVTADKDEPDEAAIGAIVDQQTKDRQWAFGKPAEGGNGPPPPKPGPASGQGPGAGGPSDYTYQPGDPRLSDVTYQMLNFDAISKAASDRAARGEI
jgi:hypothetical protein